MVVAIIGSRNLSIENLADYLPENTTAIISGGAQGVDQSARCFALENNFNFKEFLPEYEKYGRAAPLKRNITIIENSDIVLAFWNGKSRGTKFVIDNCNRRNIPIEVYIINSVK